MSRMSVIGEKRYIAHLFARLNGREMFTAQRNDAAVVAPIGGYRVALKIDRGPRSVSFQYGLSDRRVDGRLAATACCSNLLAAWSVPRASMLSITVPLGKRW